MRDVAEHDRVEDDSRSELHAPADVQTGQLADRDGVELLHAFREALVLLGGSLEPRCSERGRDGDPVPVRGDEVQRVAFQRGLADELPVPDLVRSDHEVAYPRVEVLLLLHAVLGPHLPAVGGVSGLQKGGVRRSSFDLVPGLDEHGLQSEVLHQTVEGVIGEHSAVVLDPPEPCYADVVPALDGVQGCLRDGPPPFDHVVEPLLSRILRADGRVSVEALREGQRDAPEVGCPLHGFGDHGGSAVVVGQNDAHSVVEIGVGDDPVRSPQVPDGDVPGLGGVGELAVGACLVVNQAPAERPEVGVAEVDLPGSVLVLHHESAVGEVGGSEPEVRDLLVLGKLGEIRAEHAFGRLSSTEEVDGEQMVVGAHAVLHGLHLAGEPHEQDVRTLGHGLLDLSVDSAHLAVHVLGSAHPVDDRTVLGHDVDGIQRFVQYNSADVSSAFEHPLGEKDERASGRAPPDRLRIGLNGVACRHLDVVGERAELRAYAHAAPASLALALIHHSPADSPLVQLHRDGAEPGFVGADVFAGAAP